MKRTFKLILPMICILSMVLPAPAAVFAKTDEAQTAAKTVRVSKEENKENKENDPDDTDLGPAERSKESEENRIETQDGLSEKSKAEPVARMDITEMTEIRIRSYDDWKGFAKRCTLDTWSADKYVVLEDDIEFNMKEFTPVPYFAGVFEGNNHTLNKAAYTNEQNYIGIFSKTAPTAVIRNLNVIGVMKPDGKPFDIGGIAGENAGMIANCRYEGYVEGYDYIGGIAGYNDATGIINSCNVSGKVTGLHHVGGICGANAGLVTGCAAKADINTVTKEVETSIADIKVEEIFTSLINRSRDEGNKMSIRSSNNPVDIGGIVGHNTGEISSCKNESAVGYEHVGYNVAGIAGRQSGYIHDCTNTGYIQGRKDVGGIVGQAEPYIRLDLSSDVISQISNAINELHDSVDVTIKDTDGSAGVVSARLNVIKSFADKALGDTGYLANSTTDFVNGVVGSTNEIIGRVEYVIDETSGDEGPMEDISEAGHQLEHAAKDLEDVVEDLDIDNYLTGTEKSDYDNAKKDLVSSIDEYSDYYDRAYYEKLTGSPPTKRPTKEEILKAEKDALAGGTPPEDLVLFKGEAALIADGRYRDAHNSEFLDDVERYTGIIAMTIIDNSGDMIDDAKEDGKEVAKDIKKMASALKESGKGFKNIINSVASMEPVRFPQLSEEYKLHTNSLVANIQGMSDNLGLLNSEMKGSTDTVCADLEGVNDKFASLMLLFTDAMDGALDMDYSQVFEDESNDVCEESVDATIAGCDNFGNIHADIDSGGIAGTMAEEYDFDLEGDITGVKDASRKSTYRTKCVLRDDVNRGEVKGKKSYAGGACGLHEIGTILRCKNFAKVSSESSDYVGGIAGRSYSTIRDSYEKGVLSGQSYIGGIAGASVDITDCVAMPTITKGTNFKGAIAGSADESGKLKGNVFVSDELAGTDRISRSGAAEPVSYEELMSREGIPADYSQMKVDFIVDDKVVASVKKPRGAIVSPSEMPIETDIATKGKKGKSSGSGDGKLVLAEDEYIDWDCDEETAVNEDIEINGEITRYVSSLASEQVRQNKQSIFLIDGRFVKGDTVTIAQLGKGDTEEYVIDIPRDGLKSHTVRYQMPEGVSDVVVSVDSGSGYIEKDHDTFGKYITFEAEGDPIKVRMTEIVEPDRKMLYIIIGIAVALLLVVLEIINNIIKRIRRRHQRFKEQIQSGQTPATIKNGKKKKNKKSEKLDEKPEEKKNEQMIDS